MHAYSENKKTTQHKIKAFCQEAAVTVKAKVKRWRPREAFCYIQAFIKVSDVYACVCVWDSRTTHLMIESQ